MVTAHPVTTPAAVHGAGQGGLSVLTNSVPTGRNTVHGAVVLVLQVGAHPVRTQAAIHWAVLRVLTGRADSVATGRHAVQRAVLGILEHLTDPVAAVRGAICRTGLEDLAMRACAVSAAPTVLWTGFHVERVLAATVSALRYTICGAGHHDFTVHQPQFVIPTDIVSAWSTIHCTEVWMVWISAVIDAAHAVAADGFASGVYHSPVALAVCAGCFQ